MSNWEDGWEREEGATARRSTRQRQNKDNNGCADAEQVHHEKRAELLLPGNKRALKRAHGRGRLERGVVWWRR